MISLTIIFKEISWIIISFRSSYDNAQISRGMRRAKINLIRSDNSTKSQFLIPWVIRTAIKDGLELRRGKIARKERRGAEERQVSFVLATIVPFAGPQDARQFAETQNVERSEGSSASTRSLSLFPSLLQDFSDPRGRPFNSTG